MISAYGDISDKKDAFSRLADDYLVKPFQFEELLMRMEALKEKETSYRISLRNYYYRRFSNR
jgi:DNA-binding response OmpR family regulator